MHLFRRAQQLDVGYGRFERLFIVLARFSVAGTFQVAIGIEQVLRP
jgi:hypothetical protein